MRIVCPRRPSSTARLLSAAEGAEPTYAEQGATLLRQLPDGYRLLSGGAIIGHGSDAFAAAVEGLRGWRAHDLPGMGVLPSGAVLQRGATVLVLFGTTAAAIAAPCRIIEVVDEPRRFGFAYGTLPGHPEQGEESFVVSLGDDDEVRFEIWAFSRAGDRFTRLIGPLGRATQSVATRGYLRCLEGFVLGSAG